MRELEMGSDDWFYGISQCWALSRSCTINWDALSAIGTTLAVVVALAVWLADKLLSRARRMNQARMIVTALIPRLEMQAVLLSAFDEKITPNEVEPGMVDALIARNSDERRLIASYGMKLGRVDIDAEIDRFGSLPASIGTQIVRAYTQLESVRGGAETLSGDEDFGSADIETYMRLFRDEVRKAHRELGSALDRCYQFASVRRYKLVSTAAEAVLRAVVAIG